MAEIFKPPVINLDKMKMYFGVPYTVDLENCEGKFTMYQPTIGDILEFGEAEFFSTLNIFVTTTTSCRLMLWDMGIDWTDFKDYYLFLLLFENIKSDAAKLIFHDFDITKLKLMTKEEKDEDGEEHETFTLYSEELGIEINETAYYYISQYLQYVFNIVPERKMTSDPILKKWYIKKDRREFENNKKIELVNPNDNKNSMQACISACVNHPGFKYNLHELRGVGVCEFYDSVRRLQVYENTTAIMKGLYSGFMNSKDVKPDAYNFMKVID